MYRFWHFVTRQLLDTLQPVSIVEIGVAQGQQTELLLDYVQKRSITLHCIDTVEPESLSRWKHIHGNRFIFYKASSLQILPLLEQIDVVLIDGDHNWYTVHEELRLIEQHAQKTGQFPVVLLHDTGWPYGERDLYYNPDSIPAEYRHEYAQGGLQREHDGLIADGFNASMNHALVSGGLRNGVRTAVEDFLQETHMDLHWVTIDGLHGLGILMPRSLMQAKAAVQKLLHSLTPSPELSAYISSLETERIDALMNAERHEVQRHNYQSYAEKLELHTRNAEIHINAVEKERNYLRTQMNEERRNLLSKLGDAQKNMNRMRHTMSWKLTAPLRALDHVNAVIKLKGSLKKIWKKAGDSLSGTAAVRGLGMKTGSSAQRTENIDCIIFYTGNTDQLEWTLKSIAAQTIHPVRVSIIDRTDASPDALRKYTQETRYSVQIIKLQDLSLLNEHLSIRSIASEYLMHAEAGTTFSPSYLENGLMALRATPGAGIAYSDYRLTDTGTVIHTPARIERLDEQTAEFLHPSCIVGRDALFHAWTMTGEGDPLKLWPSIMMENWTAVKNPSNLEFLSAPGGIYEMSHSSRTLPRATLCLSLSGRQWAWPLMKEFLEQQSYPHNQIHIILLDTSQHEAFGEELRTWLKDCDYREYTYLRETVGLKGVADMPRHLVQRQISDACAVIYNRLARMCTTPVAFVLEEDVIPPLDAFVRLQQLHRPGVVSVSGIYRHRQLPRLVAWDWNEQGLPVPCPFMRSGVSTVGGNGFGCVLIDGPYFRRTVLRSGLPIRNFDHNFYHQAVYLEKHTALMDWSIACRHYTDTDHWVTPH